MITLRRAGLALGLLLLVPSWPLGAQEKAAPFIVVNGDLLPADLQWDQEPKAITTPGPVYPFAAAVAGTTGRVKATAIVGPQGRINHVEITEASAPEFGAAVRAMLDAWKFEPAKKAGEPCGAWLTLIYAFSPTGGEVPLADSARAILEELKQTEPKIYGGKALDQPLKAVAQRAPMYPLVLWEKGEPGEAMIEFFIDPQGEVQLPQIVSSTEPAFGYAAAQALLAWRFAQPMKDGRPVMAKARMPVKFAASAGVAARVEEVANSTKKETLLFSYSDVDQKPVPVHGTQGPPEYPPALARAGITGSATVEFIISTDGNVVQAQATQVTHQEFGPAAVAAVLKWKFKPGKKKGRPVNVRASQKIDFNLN